MPHVIKALTREDLPELSRFLTEGFHAPPDAAFAAVDVLSWKYLESRGVDAGEAPRSLLAREVTSGRIVGHLGVCPSRWRGVGLPPEGISTLHMIDWLSSEGGVGAGASLMRQAHQAVETQYGVGGSVAGRSVGGRGGYAVVGHVPVFSRVLRPLHRLRRDGRGQSRRLLRTAKDLASMALSPPRRPSARVLAKPVGRFGPEVAPLLDAYSSRAVFTTRAPDLLNYMLGFPRGGLTGWHLVSGDRLVGLALLSVVRREEGGRLGRLAEWLLADDDPALWHASALALTDIARGQGADVVQAFASTEWSEAALVASGFAASHRLEFRLRDRERRLPTGGPFHLTPLEADYAYL